MRYHNITKDDMVNGDGLRVVLWVAGCTHCCKECQNPITWDICGGIPFDDEAKQEIFTELDKCYVSGITFSGGDPLHPQNREWVTKLSQEIKEKYPNKTQWLYTGFTWDKVCDLEIMKTLDVVIDGKFEIEHKDEKIKWRGSPNQNVIDVQNSLRTGTIIFHCKDEE